MNDENSKPFGTRGDPLKSFAEIELVSKPMWVVHFTNADPDKLANKRLKGVDAKNLGLSRDGKPGPFIFGLDINDTHSIRQGWIDGSRLHQYGTNFLLIKINQAILGTHKGDNQKQVIFTNRQIIEKRPGTSTKTEFIAGNKRISNDSLENLSKLVTAATNP